jgi:SNARE protein
VIDPNTRDRKELIQLGKETQKQGMDALDRIEKDINEMDQIGVEVQLELNKQIEQLDRIYDTVKDTETTLKRAQKYVRYFARQVYTDRCLMAMIVLIVIAIVVIIILSAVGVGKGAFNLPDQVKA